MTRSRKSRKRKIRKNSLARFSLGWFIKLLAVRLHLTFCSEKSSGQTRITHVNARRWLLIDGEAHTASTWPLFSLYFFFYLTLRYFVLLRMPEREREREMSRWQVQRERERNGNRARTSQGLKRLYLFPAIGRGLVVNLKTKNVDMKMLLFFWWASIIYWPASCRTNFDGIT